MVNMVLVYSQPLHYGFKFLFSAHLVWLVSLSVRFGGDKLKKKCIRKVFAENPCICFAAYTHMFVVAGMFAIEPTGHTHIVCACVYCIHIHIDLICIKVQRRSSKIVAMQKINFSLDIVMLSLLLLLLMLLLPIYVYISCRCCCAWAYYCYYRCLVHMHVFCVRVFRIFGVYKLMRYHCTRFVRVCSLHSSPSLCLSL